MTKPTIVVLGANGFLGKPIISALTSETFSSKINLPIQVITRDPSSQTSTELVKYVAGDAGKVESLEEPLAGADVFINLLGANPDLYANIIKALGKYGKNLKLYIPSQFGTDLDDAPINILELKTNHTTQARELGIKTVDIVTALFAAPGAFLYEYLGAVGLYAGTTKATLRGDPDLKFDISYLPDVGNVVASVATFSDYSKLPNKVRVSSDKVSQEQVIAHYEKTHDVKIERDYLSKEDALKEGTNAFTPGSSGKSDNFFLYLQFLISQGTDKGLVFSKTENELLNPKESLWKWTKFEA